MRRGHRRPILFLDFDGVLNNREFLMTPRRARDNTDFDPANIAQLNVLLHRSQARIVVSSSWRGTMATPMRELLGRAGVTSPVPVIGVTPRLHNFPTRGSEIQAWMNQADVEPEQVVILDDDNDMGDLMARLVQTSIDHGLLAGHVEQALRLWGIE